MGLFNLCDEYSLPYLQPLVKHFSVQGAIHSLRHEKKRFKPKGLGPFFGENDGIGYKNPSAVKLFIYNIDFFREIAYN